jgi:ATP-dependent helicase/nuclease subunit A
VRSLSLAEEAPESLAAHMHRPEIPLPPLRKEEKKGPIAAAEMKALAAEREEHWRLLYVAMTRAEEALFIAGSLGKRETEPAPDSWYARLSPLFGDVTVTDDVWVARREWGALSPLPVPAAKGAEEAQAELPGWALSPVGPEPRPPRPLAPSAAGEDLAPDPPLAPGVLREAAQRGVLVHRLLERLPELAQSERAAAAENWLARNAADLHEEARAEMTASALAVLAAPEWAEIFSPRALAEVPLMAVVDGRVVAGTADRVLVEKDRVLVVDYKTARRPPASLEEVPQATLRQMAAYAAALGAIYPGRRIEAALLYTAAPRLIAIPAEALAEVRRALPDAVRV